MKMKYAKRILDAEPKNNKGQTYYEAVTEMRKKGLTYQEAKDAVRPDF